MIDGVTLFASLLAAAAVIVAGATWVTAYLDGKSDMRWGRFEHELQHRGISQQMYRWGKHNEFNKTIRAKARADRG